MHIKPLLSICIPAYNRPQILLESVESMITQIKKNSLESKIEIVIVDDSTHSPVTSIIPGLVAKFPSIVYHKNEKNLGRVNTVTHIQYAHGDYILMIADDDMLTDFALPYIIDLIEKTSFDLLLHQPLFTENMDIHIPQISNTYKHFSGIDDLLAHIANAGKTYQQLVSYFSFYSSIVAKSSYLLDALANTNQEAIKKNYFPHEFLTYYNLQDKTIIFPDNVFMKGRLLNESYPSSTILITYLTDVFSFIEQQNKLQLNHNWQKIKKICLNGWKRTIYLGLLLGKLGIDYKKNRLLKKAYFIYKKYLQK